MRACVVAMRKLRRKHVSHILALYKTIINQQFGDKKITLGNSSFRDILVNTNKRVARD